jgi:GDP-6-deoxy-D-talose 4-dehydrogenase
MRILITGSDGFTGRHLIPNAIKEGFEVYCLKSNLTDFEAVSKEISLISPAYVCHLAAISTLTHQDEFEYYKVNLFGTINLLRALSCNAKNIKKVLIASSANVYGNQPCKIINEEICPRPVNHYAISKLSMEHMAMNFSNALPLIIARPFNYTGLGQHNSFLVPKIVEHFKDQRKEIELGNLNVIREYNDVRMISDIYLKLLQTTAISQIYNVCSGVPYSLKRVIEEIEKLSGATLEIKVNPKFIRENDIKSLVGDCKKIKKAIGSFKQYEISETISWMLGKPC